MKRVARSIQTVMKAIQVAEYGGPEVMVLQDNVPVPQPGPGQVLVRNYAAGVNPVDTYIRAGHYANLPRCPFVPGKDAAGVVAAVGESVTSLKEGDRVYNVFSLSGSYAEYQLTSEKDTFMLHNNLDYHQGACLGVPYFTAYRALVMRAKCRAGQSVLIHGASGAVGLAACQLGKALGLAVFGTAGTQQGMDLVLRNGASHVFNHREPGHLDQVLSVTGDKGVNIVMEMLANVNLAQDTKVVGRHGTIVVIGSRGTLEFDPRSLMGKELSVCGAGLATSTAEDYQEMAAFVYSGQELGWVKPVVGQTFALQDASKAHVEVIEHSGGTAGKIVLDIP